MQPTSTASNPLFDRDFLLATMMGPNCVRFAEELTANIPLSPHMRVLDLGCGMGLSSIYLARTFGVRVFAADLWINPSDNFARFRDFGLEDAVTPPPGRRTCPALCRRILRRRDLYRCLPFFRL